MNYPDDWFRQRYHQIKARCCNPNHRSYKHYGGRGIDMEFQSYKEIWEYVSKLEGCHPSRTLDRIDNDKGYIKGNLRWASRYTQNTNRSVKAGVVRQVNGSSRWQARITFRCKEIYLGTYDTKIEAKAALKAAAKMREVIYNDIQ